MKTKRMFTVAFIFWFLAFLAVEAMLGILAVPAWMNFAAIFFLINNGLWIGILWFSNMAHNRALDVMERLASKSMDTVGENTGKALDTANNAIYGNTLIAVGAIETTPESLKKALANGKAKWVLQLPNGKVGPVEFIDQ